MKLKLGLFLIFTALLPVALYQTILAAWMCAHPVHQSAYWESRFYLAGGSVVAASLAWTLVLVSFIRSRTSASGGLCLRAELRLGPDKNGRRLRVLRDGIGVFLEFDGAEDDRFAFLRVDPDQEPLEGQKCLVLFELPPAQWGGSVIRAKATFVLKEGHKVIGSGTVLEFLEQKRSNTVVKNTNRRIQE